MSSMTPPPMRPLTADERRDALNAAAATYVANGYVIDSQLPDVIALHRGRRPNHTLHAILTIFTCLVWGIAWIVLGLSMKEQRILLRVDEYGRPVVQRAT